MDTKALIDSLRQDLTRAAEIGGEDVKTAAERLLLALDPALRLTLMDALSQAAAEIGEALPGVTIDVRLQGREPVFVVVGAPAAEATHDHFDGDDLESDDEAVARITLRIPEALKARAEVLANHRGQSLNTWLVAAARAAASDGSRPHRPGRHGGSGRRVQGWAK